MKLLIAELFKRLGFTDSDAWINTYLETNDIEGLSRHMGRPEIVAQFIENQ